MKALVYLIFIFFIGCASNKCYEENKIFLRFKDILKEQKALIKDKDSIDDAGDLARLKFELEQKEKLFSKICKNLGENERALILEVVPMFNNERRGLIYLYETNKLLYFQSSDGNGYKVEQGYNGFSDLKKVLDVLKPDFKNKLIAIKEFFNKEIVLDGSGLRVLLIDGSSKKIDDGYEGFSYQPDRIMSEEFDNEFLNLKNQ